MIHALLTHLKGEEEAEHYAHCYKWTIILCEYVRFEGDAWATMHKVASKS